jgi:hypothetical protein
MSFSNSDSTTYALSKGRPCRTTGGGPEACITAAHHHSTDSQACSMGDGHQHGQQSSSAAGDATQRTHGRASGGGTSPRPPPRPPPRGASYTTTHLHALLNKRRGSNAIAQKSRTPRQCGRLGPVKIASCVSRAP